VDSPSWSFPIHLFLEGLSALQGLPIGWELVRLYTFPLRGLIDLSRATRRLVRAICSMFFFSTAEFRYVIFSCGVSLTFPLNVISVKAHAPPTDLDK